MANHVDAFDHLDAKDEAWTHEIGHQKWQQNKNTNRSSPPRGEQPLSQAFEFVFDYR